MPFVLKRAKTLLYVIALHFVQTVCDLALPNLYGAHRVRGTLLRPFFAASGKNVAIASGCVINCGWNLRLGDGVYIAHNCWINAAAGLEIGDGAILSPNVVVVTTSHDRVAGAVALHKSRQAPVVIGRGVWIASNSVVTRGTTIGEGTVVGAGSVVFGELQSNALYAGAPARHIRDFPI